MLADVVTIQIPKILLSGEVVFGLSVLAIYIITGMLIRFDVIEESDEMPRFIIWVLSPLLLPLFVCGYTVFYAVKLVYWIFTGKKTFD